MKKTFSLIMLAMLMATGAMAQKMVVKTTDKQTVMYDIPNVECVAFVDGYVDLGLPSGTLWATCNVGASSPEEYGDFFAWGETEPKSEYAWTNYFDYDADDASNRYKKYNNDGGLTELLPEDDAATVNMGEGWQTPSMEQFQELIDPSNTTTVWTEQNGVYGRMITGKNSQYIFLPAAGFRWGTSYNGAGSDGYYWSRTLNASSGLAEGLLFGSSSISGLSSGRGMGWSVRPVVFGAKQIQKIPVTSIALNHSTLYMQPDGTKQLTATVEPEDASNKAVTWTSSDASVATVSTGGLVTAKAEGTCTITCSAMDGSGVKAECQVKVSTDDRSGSINGHDYVDLALPSGTLWATTNVGGEAPESCGAISGGATPEYRCGYFKWGEYGDDSIYGDEIYYQYYNDAGYKGYTKYVTQSRYGYNGFTDNLTELLPEDDAATINWGSEWQTPSVEQLDELIDENYTTSVWTTLNGVNGIRIISKSNGNSIFLPAGGYGYGYYWNYDDEIAIHSVGNVGYYWSRTLYTENNSAAYDLTFSSSQISTGCEGRSYGQSVRAVVKQ